MCPEVAMLVEVWFSNRGLVLAGQRYGCVSLSLANDTVVLEELVLGSCVFDAGNTKQEVLTTPHQLSRMF